MLQGKYTVNFHVFSITLISHSYSVETQLQGTKGNFSALAFEVIPSQDVISRPIILASFEVTILTLTGKAISVYVTCETFVWELKNMIEDHEGIPPDQQRLISGVGRAYQMEDKGEHLLHSRFFVQLNQISARLIRYGIEAKCKVHLVLRLRGGGYSTPWKKNRYILPNYEMSLGAGGRIRQRVADILTDPYDPDIWDIDRIAFFNVNILDSKDFRRITDHAAPVSPIDAAAKLPVNAADYAKLNLPYFNEAEEVLEGVLPTEEAEQASEDSTIKKKEQDTGKEKSLKSLCEMGVLSEPSQNSTSVLVTGLRQFEPAVLMLARAQAMKLRSDEDAKRPDSDFEGMEASEREKYNSKFGLTLDEAGTKPARNRSILSRFKHWLSRTFTK